MKHTPRSHFQADAAATTSNWAICSKGVSSQTWTRSNYALDDCWTWAEHASTSKGVEYSTAANRCPTSSHPYSQGNCKQSRKSTVASKGSACGDPLPALWITICQHLIQNYNQGSASRSAIHGDQEKAPVQTPTANQVTEQENRIARIGGFRLTTMHQEKNSTPNMPNQ